MNQYWKPIGLLLILSTLLTEILSGNLPLVAGLLQPFTIFLFMTIGYGFPVLILREIWIRKQLGLLQVFLLGVGYGIYNEGLYARTIFFPYHSPVEGMSLYGLMGDVRVPWLLSISAWHALYAVIFPIIIVHYFFPTYAEKSWISKKTAWGLGLLGVGLGIWRFLDPTIFAEQISGGILNLVFMLLCAAVLWGAVLCLPTRPTVTTSGGVASWKYFYVGVALLLGFYLVPVLLGGAAVPVSIFALYFAGTVGVFGYLALREPTLSLQQMWRIVLGGEAACALLAFFLALFSGNTVLMVTSILFATLFVFLAFRKR